MLIAHTYRRCGSTKRRTNRHTVSGHHTIHCYETLDSQTTVWAQRKELGAQLPRECISQRVVTHTLKMSRRTVAGVRPIGKTITPLQERLILACDERWACIGKKRNGV